MNNKELTVSFLFVFIFQFATTSLAQNHEDLDGHIKGKITFTGASRFSAWKNFIKTFSESNSCKVLIDHQSGYGVCFTGIPETYIAEVVCENQTSNRIVIEDPNYHACPPVKILKRPGRSNFSENADTETWQALHTPPTGYTGVSASTVMDRLVTDVISAAGIAGQRVTGVEIDSELLIYFSK